MLFNMEEEHVYLLDNLILGNYIVIWENLVWTICLKYIVLWKSKKFGVVLEAFETTQL